MGTKNSWLLTTKNRQALNAAITRLPRALRELPPSSPAFEADMMRELAQYNPIKELIDDLRELTNDAKVTDDQWRDGANLARVAFGQKVDSLSRIRALLHLGESLPAVLLLARTYLDGASKASDSGNGNDALTLVVLGARMMVRSVELMHVANRRMGGNAKTANDPKHAAKVEAFTLWQERRMGKHP